MKIPEIGENAELGKFHMGNIELSSNGFLNLDNSVLAFGREVYMGALGSSLEYSGNVYSSNLADRDEEVFILNVTATYNCLDTEKTVYRKARGSETGEDHGLGIVQPAFFPKLIGGSNIFRIPQMRSAIFVASDGSGSEEDFYSLYQTSGLVGLKFDEVWRE